MIVGATFALALGLPVCDAESPPARQPELAHLFRTVRHVFVQPASEFAGSRSGVYGVGSRVSPLGFWSLGFRDEG